MNIHLEQRLAELLYKSIREELSAEESEELRNWQTASPAHELFYRRVHQEDYPDQELALFIQGEKKNDLLWQNIRQQSFLKRRRKVRRWISWSSVAALLCLSIGMTHLLYFHKTGVPDIVAETVSPGKSKAQLILASGEKIELGEKVLTGKITENGVTIGGDTSFLKYEENLKDTSAVVAYHELVIPKGGEYRLQMADGTVVYLNAESRLKFPVLFNKRKREVYLEGEAYFEVRASGQHPFIVHTAAVEVNVLGTGFNVMAYENDAYAQVTLVHGKVDVETAAGKVAIQPAEQLVFDKVNGEQSVRKVKVDDFVAWKDGVLTFDAMPLKELAAKLSRWYNVDFFFTAEGLKQLKFSGTLKKYTDIQSVLEFISATTDVQFILKDRTVTVSRK